MTTACTSSNPTNNNTNNTITTIRLPCTVTANTCGACYDGYISPLSIGNDICISLSSRRLSTTLIEKTCTDNCNGRGSCAFINVNTGSKLSSSDTCSVLDPTCAATCICKEGYDGQLCSYTKSQLQLKQGKQPC